MNDIAIIYNEKRTYSNKLDSIEASVCFNELQTILSAGYDLLN